MYGNKSIKKRKDGSNYKDFYYYGCKHRNMTRGHKCDYKKQVHEEMLDASVAEVISKLVSNPKFSDLIRNKINMEVDTSALDQEIENYKIQLRKLYHNKDTILSDMDSLDYEDKHYQRRKIDLENHLYKTYDKIDDAEELLVSAKAKKRSLLADKITGDNIYKALVFFDKLYAQMNEGYVAKDYYLEFSEDLGKPIKIEEDTTVESDTFEGLADGIREIERLQDKLIQREKQLAVLEDKIKRENQDYEDKYNNENVAKLRAFDERDTAKKELQEILKDYYVDIKSILSKVHYHEYQYMDKVGKKDLILMIEKEYELGRLLGKTSKEVSLELGCYLIGIYDYFQEYSKSFDVMLVMAELSDYWVDLETATLNWANKEHILYKLYNEIERALVNYRVKNERRKNFEGYLQTIKKIRGY
jgi:predicted  nucleic acid-binding Zn-ribbon protein